MKKLHKYLNFWAELTEKEKNEKIIKSEESSRELSFKNKPLVLRIFISLTIYRMTRSLHWY